MDRQDEELNALRRKVTYLERENQILKEMMQEFGLDYQASLQKKCGAEPEQFDPNQGARIHELQITDNTPAYFYKRFWGRQDVYELRYTNAKTGKVGYYTQCYNFWHDGCHKLKKDGIQCKHCEYQAYKPLNKNVVLAHLKGKDPNANDVVAVYPMLPGNFCRFLVF